MDQREATQRAWEQAISDVYSVSPSGGPWVYTNVTTRLTHGWKIHASCTAQSAFAAVSRLRVLFDERPFIGKTLQRHRDIAKLNAGAFGYSQVGKTFTFYGREDELAALLEPLRACFDGLAGPIVPFERRLPTSRTIFYRYGSYGRDVEDDRRCRSAPSDVSDPFCDGRSESTIFSQTPLYSCLSQRPKGGVYLALDLRSSPARRIVIKEGRRNGECDTGGVDGFSLVFNEHRALKAVASLGIAPKPLGARETDDAYFLDTEFIEGASLAKVIHSRRYDTHRCLALANSIARKIATLHHAGLVWGDCKAENVIVMGRAKVKLLDFESVSPVFAPAFVPGWRSETVAAPASQRYQRDARPADIYAFGKMLSQLYKPVLSRRGAREIASLLTRMTQRNVSARPRADAVSRSFAAMAGKRLPKRPPKSRGSVLAGLGRTAG